MGTKSTSPREDSDDVLSSDLFRLIFHKEKTSTPRPTSHGSPTHRVSYTGTRPAPSLSSQETPVDVRSAHRDTDTMTQ